MKKILIIDDESEVAEIMAAFLCKMGYSVKTATVVSNAFKIYTNYSPDLVICDVNMPEMDGFEVLSKFRDEVPGQPFVMVTGSFLNPAEFQILKEQKVTQIIKPPDLERELLSTVRNKLDNLKN